MTPQTFCLAHDTARQRAMQAVKEAPQGIYVVIKEGTRSLEQNALIHALLTNVGNAVDWKFNGQIVDIDDLKTIFMGAYRKASGVDVRCIVGIDGQPIILNWRTRDLTKKECSEFVEMVNAWLAERIAA